MTDMDEARLTDAAALDAIADMLRDPEWGVGMLEDAADIALRTGRSIQGTCGSCGHPADGTFDERCASDGCPCPQREAVGVAVEHTPQPTWDRH